MLPDGLQPSNANGPEVTSFTTITPYPHGPAPATPSTTAPPGLVVTHTTAPHVHHTQIIALTDSRLADLRAAIRTASGDAFRDTFLPASHAQAIINVIAHHVLGPQGHATITNICLQSPGAADINYGPATVRGANNFIKNTFRNIS